MQQKTSRQDEDEPRAGYAALSSDDGGCKQSGGNDTHRGYLGIEVANGGGCFMGYTSDNGRYLSWQRKTAENCKDILKR